MATFLIADDADGKRIMLEAFVKELMPDVTLLLATSTEEAKDIITEEVIDYAFIDYEMPSENGPAVIRYLKEMHPASRVVLVTASSKDKYRKDAIDAGAEDVIVTSYGEEETRERVAAVIEKWLVARSG